MIDCLQWFVDRGIAFNPHIRLEGDEFEEGRKVWRKLNRMRLLDIYVYCPLINLIATSDEICNGWEPGQL